MAFVLDASVPACWALLDEGHSIADVALDTTCRDGIVVPSLWWFEMRNLLIVAQRRKRSTGPDWVNRSDAKDIRGVQEAAADFA